MMHKSTPLSIGSIIAGLALVLSMGVSAAFAEDGHGGRDRDRVRGGDRDEAVVVVNQNAAPRVDNDMVDNDVNDDNDNRVVAPGSPVEHHDDDLVDDD